MATVPNATSQDRRLLRYDDVAVAIHWLTASFLFAQLYTGFVFSGMERGAARSDLFAWHKTIGATILLLSLIRLGWRLANPPPPYPDDMPRWERLAGTWNHRLFYVMLLALPLTGLAAVSAGQPAGTTDLVGGIPLPMIPGVPGNADESLGGVHEALVFGTIALLVLHVGAALKHRFVDRARYAGRMPPFRSPDGERATPPAGRIG